MKHEQISLPMVEQFPNKPQECPPNWREMADQADQYLMDPANGVLRTGANGNQYFTAFLEGKSKELITFGCMALGKILRGDDVSALVPGLSDFYNDSYGLFLNDTLGRRIEYWYLMDVNGLADAIIKLTLSNDPAVMQQWRNSADRLIELARKLNYDFNAQGYEFDKDTSFTVKDAYRQPDAIAGYAYLMTFAHVAFQEDKYLKEAVKAMELYQSFEENPWYEIPSGAMASLAAAYLNGKGQAFDLEKILNFVFDTENGSMLAGKWGDQEINGIMIGWRGYSREYATSSAYSMETMIVLPYVLPVVRYDSRFARAIGKYALHAASNARLFFSGFLPEDYQSRPDLRPEIPYEKLDKSHEGKSPYGTGDCEGHKSVYGGGFTLWWGSIIEQTNEAFIPRFDVTTTDFLEDQTYPTYLYYNPWEDERTVALDAGVQTCDVYELTSHHWLYRNVSGKIDIRLPADSAKVVALVPSGGEQIIEGGKLKVNGVVVDFRMHGMGE